MQQRGRASLFCPVAVRLCSGSACHQWLWGELHWKPPQNEHVSKALLSAPKCPHSFSEQRLWGQSLWGRAGDACPIGRCCWAKKWVCCYWEHHLSLPHSRSPRKKRSLRWFWELKDLPSGPLQLCAGVQLLSATFPLVLAQSNAGWVADSSICWAAHGMGLVFQSSCVSISQAVM